MPTLQTLYIEHAVITFPACNAAWLASDPAVLSVCVTESAWVDFDVSSPRSGPISISFTLDSLVLLVTVFKNITNIFIAAGEYYLFGTPVEYMVMLAFGIMLGGAVFAAWNDIYISYIGLLWMLGNCFSTAGYVLYLKFATKTVKLSKFGMVFYNNVLCTLFLLPVASAMGEVRTFLTTKTLHTVDYGIKNFCAGFVGFFLNFASLNCVSITGPTTYAIVGSINKIPTTILGWFLFDAVVTTETWFFIAVSMVGGFVYSYAKIRGSKAALSK